MHEYSIAAELIDAVMHHLAENLDVRVATVYVQVGRLSGIEPQLLLSAFELQAPPQLGPACKLILEDVPLRLVCDACGNEFQPPTWDFFCSSCHSGNTRVIAGEQLVLRRLVLEPVTAEVASGLAESSEPTQGVHVGH